MIRYRDRATPSVVQMTEGRHGRFLTLATDRYIGSAFRLYGEYSESEADLWRQLVKPNHLVLDIGANVGAHTVHLSQIAGRVLAFEPVRFIYHLLCGNVALAGCTNVETYLAGCGDQTTPLKVPPFDFTQRDNYGGYPLLQCPDGNDIPQLRVDDIVPGCHFMKIDVEGMELNVLQGADRVIRESRPILYVENNPDTDQSVLIDYIHGLGYDLWWHHAPYYNPENWRAAPCDADHQNVVSWNMLGLPHNPANRVNGLEMIPRA